MVQKRSSSFGVICAVVILAFPLATVPGVARGEEVDNPQYQAWAKYKPGSTRTLAGELGKGSGLSMEMTSTLKDVTPEHATLSTKTTVNMMGQSRQRPEVEQPVAARMQPRDISAAGEEDVEAAGKTYKCRVFDVRSESSGRANAAPTSQPAPSTARIWVSSDVPGGLVKMIVHTPGGDMTLLLKSFEAK